MGIVVVVGGQFGGEGKGKTTAHLCRAFDVDVAVRCGGPNSGHTITINGEQIILRQVPAGVVNPHTKLFLAAGCLVDIDVLLEEIQRFKLTPDRLRLDKNAVIIETRDIEGEAKANLENRIGSTCSGVGFAVARRVLREDQVRLVKDVPELETFIADVSEEVIRHEANNDAIIIEGTQGFGLSVYHSPYYPYATSRDTTAAGFLSEVGISPLAVSEITMVIRTFPIRVGGNSGPLPKETSWKGIQVESGYPYKIEECASVTRRLRRVGNFDLEIVKKAVSVNKPTNLALMGVDYLDYKNKGVKDFDSLTPRTKDFIHQLERELKVRIKFIGTGPMDSEIIDLSEKTEAEQKGMKSERLIGVSVS